jgi:ABC-2 type transport system permease protein
VFFLTLAALYGLGMMLSGLFLIWGREAWHMTQLLQEPVYFVSGLNFPVASLGMLGALAISTLPLAVGLDAMRQLAFAGSPNANGFFPPEVEALVLVVMMIVFIGLSRVLLRVIERRARLEGTLSTRGG